MRWSPKSNGLERVNAFTGSDGFFRNRSPPQGLRNGRSAQIQQMDSEVTTAVLNTADA